MSWLSRCPCVPAHSGPSAWTVPKAHDPCSPLICTNPSDPTRQDHPGPLQPIMVLLPQTGACLRPRGPARGPMVSLPGRRGNTPNQQRDLGRRQGSPSGSFLESPWWCMRGGFVVGTPPHTHMPGNSGSPWAWLPDTPLNTPRAQGFALAVPSAGNVLPSQPHGYCLLSFDPNSNVTLSPRPSRPSSPPPQVFFSA